MFELELFENDTKHIWTASDKEAVLKKVRGWLARFRPDSLTLVEADGERATIFCAWFIAWDGKVCKFPSLDNAAVAFTDACFHTLGSNNE